MRNILFTLPFCFTFSLSTAGQLDVLDAASVFGGIVLPTSSTSVTITPQGTTQIVTGASEPLITPQAVSNALPSPRNLNNELVTSKGINNSSDAFLKTLAAISAPKQIESWLSVSSREETQEVELLLNELLQLETVTQSEAKLYLDILRTIRE